MSKLKIFVIILLTMIISIMSLGYAALQERIDIEGEASIDSTYRVEITRVSEGTINGNARSTEVPSYTGLQASFNVGLTNTTDYITYIVEITNYSSVDIRLNNTTITSTNNNIAYTKTGIRNGDTMLAGSTKTITLKIKVKEATQVEQTAIVNLNLDFTRLKGGVGKVASDLPNGYRECEYIETDGSAYFDTGIVPDGTLISQLKFRTNSSSSAIIIGTRSSSSNSKDYEGINYRLFKHSDYFYFDIGYGISNGQNNRLFSGYNTAATNNIYELEIGNRYIKDINTDTILKSDNALDNTLFNYSSEYTIKIFGSWPEDFSRGTNLAGLRIYYLKMYQSNNLVRDFVPALDNSNVPCLYDIVTGETFYNEGTGDFLYQLKE